MLKRLTIQDESWGSPVLLEFSSLFGYSLDSNFMLVRIQRLHSNLRTRLTGRNFLHLKR